MSLLWFFSIIASSLSLLYGTFLIWKVLNNPAGSAKMIEIASAIQEGAKAYLWRQYKTIFIFALIIGLILGFAPNIGWKLASGFWIGGFFSAIAGIIGMNISVKTNVRVAEAAKKGLKSAFDISVKGGAISGVFVGALALLSVSFFYIFTKDLNATIGVGFGASLISLFARIGGGIYTKAADVGADLVGKIEAKIPEDDPRNPAAIADNVGDNVGDCAGMAADLFETKIVSIIGAMFLGSILLHEEKYVIYPLLVGSIGLLASVIGTFFVKIGQGKNIMMALYKGLTISAILALIGFFIASWQIFSHLAYFYSALVGVILTVGLFILSEYYTSKNWRPVKEVALASKSGAATNIITGLSFGMESTFLPIILIAVSIIGSYAVGGIYGIAISVSAMLSLTTSIITLDAYGPITDNAGGIAEMSNLPENVRKVTDALDAVGNTTKAVTKAFAIGSAGLAALTLFAAYLAELDKVALGKDYSFDLQNPLVLAGLLIGGSIPYLFSSLALRAVGNAAFKVIDEVRRQFREFPDILKGTRKPDYGKAVDIVTQAALKKMILPTTIGVISPLITGLILGPSGLGGLLLGVIITGLFVALQMANGGATWDNAKKYIEDGNYGGKGSEAHAASVIGDTVGDPYKDTAGPAINPLIKVINTLAIIFLTVIINHHLTILK